MKALFINTRNVLWLYKPYLKYGKLLVALSLILWILLEPAATLVGVILPNAIIDFLNAGLPFTQIALVVIGFQLFLMFKPMYEDVFNMFCKNKTLPRIELQLRRDIYERAIKTDYRYIDNPEYYDNYTWAVNEYAGKAAEAQDLVNRIASSVITIVSMLVVIGALSPIAIVVTIVGGVVENLLYMVTNYFDVKKDMDVAPYDRRLAYYHRVFYQNNYAADLKSTNVKKHIFAGFERAGARKLETIRSYAHKMIWPSLTADLTFYIARTFVILNIVYGIYTGNIASVGAYVTMMLAVDRLTDTMNRMFYYVKAGNRLGMYATRIRAFFDDTESVIETDEYEGKQVPPQGAYDVSFENVSFRYENSSFAISGLNLVIERGEKVAIVGENGAGKSTLVKLMLRLYDVSEGAININGANIKTYDLDALRRKIGVAFQSPNIYAISLAENIWLYNEVDDDELRDVAHKLGLDGVSSRSGVGFSAEMTREFDENGVMLSGGEVQKIGLARIFTGEFGLLLLDEPSSALDPLAEYDMTKLILDSGNRATTIMVAHRLSTIRNADRIILVDRGQIKEMGSHDELMALKGKYHEMFTKQAENYIG